jgi:hypothetical protein
MFMWYFSVGCMRGEYKIWGGGHRSRSQVTCIFGCINFIESEWGGNLLVAMHRNQNDEARNE